MSILSSTHRGGSTLLTEEYLYNNGWVNPYLIGGIPVIGNPATGFENVDKNTFRMDEDNNHYIHTIHSMSCPVEFVSVLDFIGLNGKLAYQYVCRPKTIKDLGLLEAFWRASDVKTKIELENKIRNSDFINAFVVHREGQKVSRDGWLYDGESTKMQI